MNSPSIDYEKLELLPAGSLSGHPSPKIAQRLKTVMGQLVRFFAPDNTPKVRSYRSQTGEVRFDVYDPVTQQRSRHRSEEALRIWLEERHHENARQDLS